MSALTTRQRERQGVLLCLLSAATFGAMAIFAKLSYEAGFDVRSLLLVRFVLAAAVLWAIVALRRPARPARRTVLIAIGLGAIGYTAQSGTFFSSLERLDASLASLVLYVYPALVLLGALLLGRERPTRRRLLALAVATAGAGLVLAGGGTGQLDAVGLLLAFGAAVSYSVYILVADRTTTRSDPFLLTAMIISAAAVALGLWNAAAGGPRLDVEPVGWLLVAAVALVSTVLPVAAFMLGLQRVGPGSAAIVSTAEPVVTVGLAMLVFGDRLSPLQALGAVGVVVAVVLVNARGRRHLDSAGEPSPVAAGASSAGSLAQRPAGG